MKPRGIGQVPAELKDLFASQIVDFKVSLSPGSPMPDRSFIDVSIPNESSDLKVSIVIFQDDDWDFVSIKYKNCIYQDEPKELMLNALDQLMKGNLKKSKALLGRKDKWLILDERGKVILAPYDAL